MRPVWFELFNKVKSQFRWFYGSVDWTEMNGWINGTNCDWQRQQVRMVPVTEIHYTWKRRAGRFYLYGYENKVHAPEYPQTCCWGCSVLWKWKPISWNLFTLQLLSPALSLFLSPSPSPSLFRLPWNLLLVYLFLFWISFEHRWYCWFVCWLWFAWCINICCSFLKTKNWMSNGLLLNCHWFCKRIHHHFNPCVVVFSIYISLSTVHLTENV